MSWLMDQATATLHNHVVHVVLVDRYPSRLRVTLYPMVHMRNIEVYLVPGRLQS